MGMSQQHAISHKFYFFSFFLPLFFRQFHTEQDMVSKVINDIDTGEKRLIHQVAIS